MATGDLYRKPQRGDPFHPSAAQFGMLLDVARQFNEQTGPSLPPTVASWFQHLAPLVKNTTASTIPVGGCLRLNGSQINPANNLTRFQQVVLTGAATTGPTNAIAVATSPMRAGEVKPCVVGGAVAVRIIGTGTAAAAQNASSVLRCLSTGYQLLYQESGSLERWGIILLGGAGGGCSPKSQLAVIGDPSAGTFVVRLRAKDAADAWVTRDLTFTYNMTAAAILALIETHPEIEAGLTVVTGGPLTGPAVGARSNVTITLPPNAMWGDGTTTIVSTSLTRRGLSLPQVALDECCS